MPKFEDIFAEIKTQVVALAKSEMKNFADEAITDVTDYYESSKEKLKKWTMLLIEKKIDEEEFKTLMNFQLGLGEMKVLTNTGIAQTKIDKFKNAVINTVVDTVLSKALRL